MGILTCLLLFFVVPSMGQNSFSNKTVLNNGIFNVSWNFNASLDTFEFLLEVRTTGWIGFGFALNAPTNMMDYDVAVGGVLSNGTTYLQDYYTTGQIRPDPDPQQDFIIINGSEQNGVTSLTFSRRRNTTDALDVAIQPGMSIFLVWAYHPSVDAQPSSFSQHPNDARGVMQQTLIPAAITPTPTPAMATPAITATPVVDVRPMHFANFLQLDNNGNYNVSWVYNNSMDTLHFMVEVKTTGWIGFGVATQAPNMMMNYDVAVGGVSGGAGYLWDYLTVGRRPPQLDLQQDWMLTYSREENNVTTLRFYRQRDTNDSANDTVIQPGVSIHLVWAYHSSVDAQASSFPQHSNDTRGVPMQQTLIPAAITPTPTPGPTPTPKIYQNNAIFDNGNFKVYWSYNSSADSLYFTLDVAAVGWIGFGFSENNMGMNRYDVAVGGVRNGQMYLQDYLTNGYAPPNADQQQDVNLMYAIERDGRTMISYTRKRDTGDLEGDLAIERGKEYYFIWAYHSNSDNVRQMHETRGFQRMVVIAADVVETTPVATTGPNQGGGAGQGGGPAVGNLSYYFSSS
ncbi:DBH-like monooxygenase protein 1 [Porites harrisoni]